MKPILGIVGGIGSGKSFVSDELVRRGGYRIVGDALGHEGLRQPEIKQLIREHWGERVFDSNGEVDRRNLAHVVFADRGEREKLERIQFPYIERRIREEIAKAEKDPAVKFAILDAAVLLEAGWKCDHLIFIDTPREVRLERLRQSRGWTEADLAARERNQMPLEEKRKAADAILMNNGSAIDVARQLDEFFGKWVLDRGSAGLE
jgi:dephospho-CoA kinase